MPRASCLHCGVAQCFKHVPFLDFFFYSSPLSLLALAVPILRHLTLQIHCSWSLNAQVTIMKASTGASTRCLKVNCCNAQCSWCPHPTIALALGGIYKTPKHLTAIAVRELACLSAFINLTIFLSAPVGTCIPLKIWPSLIFWAPLSWEMLTSIKPTN